eukprot:2313907-Pleurochrysis_carterae.AAC.1
MPLTFKELSRATTEKSMSVLHLTSASSTTEEYPLYGNYSNPCTEKQMQDAFGIARQRGS